MSPAPKSLLSRLAFPLLVALAAVLLWIGYTDRWSLDFWRTPEGYDGDPCEIFARVRLAMDDPLQPLLGFPHSERLAAPFGADWSLYPVGDAPTFAIAGLLGRAVGPFAAVNLLGCALIAAAALSFYLCARRLRWRPEWAACAALLFAFSNYNLRWLVTLSFSQTWTLPPLLLLCTDTARPAPVIAHNRRRSLLLATALGIWLGWGNPYFVFFAGCVIAGAVVLNRLRRAPWSRLAPLALLTATMAVTIVASHWGFFAAKLSGTAGTEQFDRGYTGAEIYALKPLDLVVPPEDHRSHLLRDLGRIYASDTALKGEPFYNYLGLVGIAGLGLLAFVALRRAARPTPQHRVPDAALGALLCGLLATVGGGTAALALGNIDWFRASNRIGVFFSLWALFFLFGVLHRATRSRPRWLTLALAGAIGVAGWFEQTPWFDYEAARTQAAAKLAADRTTVAAIERTVGSMAMVFQLPSVPFPEAGKTRRMVDYEHFRPFLVSHTLCFSYGALRGPASINWTSATARLDAPELVARLQDTGFSALWIDRRGYADSAEALLAQLRALGLAEIPSARAEIALFRLTPRSPALAPNLGDARILPLWEPFAGNPPADSPWLLDCGNWSPAERAPGRVWRWARRSATLGIDWRGPATEGELHFTANSAADARLSIRADGREIGHADLIGGQRLDFHVTCPLKPGLQHLTFEYPGRLRRLGRDSRQIGFMIENLVCTPQPSERNTD
jgi:hypothetical protein